MMRTEFTRTTLTGIVLCSLALMSTVFVAGCTSDSSAPAPASSPADSGNSEEPASDGSGTQGGSNEGSGTQSGGDGSGSR